MRVLIGLQAYHTDASCTCKDQQSSGMHLSASVARIILQAPLKLWNLQRHINSGYLLTCILKSYMQPGARTIVVKYIHSVADVVNDCATSVHVYLLTWYYTLPQWIMWRPCRVPWMLQTSMRVLTSVYIYIYIYIYTTVVGLVYLCTRIDYCIIVHFNEVLPDGTHSTIRLRGYSN